MTKHNPDYPPVVVPDSVERTRITFWSNGVALDGDLFRPKSLRDDAQVPAVVLAHGWGGDKGTTERYGALLAERLGVIALGFSFSTWGASGGQLQATGPDALAVGRSGDVAITQVRAVRELVDPINWLQDYRAAVDYLEGEPNVDVSRIGAWGTSFGGGIAMHTAANDPRITALCVQVAAVIQPTDRLKSRARTQAIAIARGLEEPVPQGGGAAASNLDGTPHYARMAHYDVMAEVHKLRVPTLMIDAGNEVMFDIAENSGRVHEILRAAGTPHVRYEIIAGIDHYGIYFEGFEQSAALACEWFAEHL
jgi:dienelactone hydrolase